MAAVGGSSGGGVMSSRAKSVGRYRATFGVVGIAAAFYGAAMIEDGSGAGWVVMLAGFGALSSLLPGCGREYTSTDAAPMVRRHHSIQNKRKKG